MKGIIKAIIIVVIVFFASCKSEKNKTDKQMLPVYKLNKLITNDSTLFLSDFFKQIQYIKPETKNESYLGKILQVECVDSNLYILDDTHKIFHFNTNGLFKGLIGKKGLGPGEYTFAVSFAVLPKKDILAVYDIKNLKILLYNLKGEYINEFHVDSYPLKIASLGEKFIVAAITYPEVIGNNYYSLSVYNLNGDKVASLINRKSELENTKTNNNEALEGRLFLQNTNNELIFWEHDLDTVYGIKSDLTINKKYILQNQKQEIKSTQKNIDETSFWYGKIADLGDYIFIDPCISDNKVKHLFIDKKTKSGFNYMVYNNLEQSKQLQYGLINDIDGGIPVIPLKIMHNNKVYTTFFGLELKSLLKTPFYENQRINDIKTRKTLDSLISSSSAYDNPLIMVLTLK